MVRRIVFMTVRIAQGKLTIADLQKALESGADASFRTSTAENEIGRLVHGLAPARGLILTEVHYPPEIFRTVEDNNKQESRIEV
jgi:tRNA U38,U39,U40 pseudouridine synthase TruA